MKNIKPRDMDVYEILDELSEIKSKDNQVEWLKTKFSDHNPLQYIIKMNYCNTITSMLPPGEPPFRKQDTDGPTPGSLWSYLKMFPVFVRSNQSVKMKMSQIERVFIEMLEAIEPKEAEMVCLAKDRALASRWELDVDVFKRAFPSLAIQDAVMPVQSPPTPEEAAEDLLASADKMKADAKALQAEAKKLTEQAKQLLKEVKDEASVG